MSFHKYTEIKFVRSLFSSNIQETRQNTFVLSKNRDERMQWAKMEVVVIIDRWGGGGGGDGGGSDGYCGDGGFH